MKKALSLILAVVMVISIFAVPTFAVEKEVSQTRAWSTSYTITGNGANDIVAVAQAQLEKSKSDLGYSGNWCAAFVSDCARLAGQDTAVPYHAAVSSLYTKVINAGGKVVSTPQKGDIAFYKSGSSFCHVSIVSDGSGNTIHGNVSWCTSTGRDNGLWHVCTRKPNVYENAMGQYHVYVRPNYNNNTHTHSYNTYVYYEAVHPHYKCYKCSCGAIQRNTSQPTNIANCEKCLPDAPVLNVRAGTSAEYTQFCWNATTNTDAYEIYVYDADTNEIVFYYYSIPTLGYQIKIPAGKYKACAVSINSKLYGSSKWWTQGDGVTFTVEEGEFSPASETIYNGNKYELFDITMPWTEAKAKCEELGGHLVTITSKEEASIVNELLDKGEKTNYWIGLSDEITEGKWENVTGEEVLYTNWNTNEPNNYLGYEDYVSIITSNNYLWNDVIDNYGNASLGFVCEYENVESEITLGDVNGDGEVTVMDATIVQRSVAKLAELTEEQKTAGDTNNDGDISVTDATTIQRFVAKLIEEF